MTEQTIIAVALTCCTLAAGVEPPAASRRFLTLDAARPVIKAEIDDVVYRPDRTPLLTEYLGNPGNGYLSGRSGLLVLSPDGTHLSTIITPKRPHSFSWGDDNSTTLYLCARSGLCRTRLNIAGVRP